MQREKEEKKRQFFSAVLEGKSCRRQRRILNMGSEGEDLSEGEWAPLVSKLAMIKTLTCRPWMKTTKKTKMITEKSSFQKV